MKNIVLSAVAVFAMSSFAVAGGDIMAPEEPMVDVPEVMEVEVVDQGFYIGLGYGSMGGEETYKWNPGLGEVTLTEDTRDFDQLLFQAGYKYNQYVAFEGRYWFGMNDLSGDYYHDGFLYDTDASIDAWGIFVKPMYPVTPEFDVYALLGYGGVMLDSLEQGDAYESGFQWGLGAGYVFTEEVSVFVDYVSLYDDTGFDYRAQDVDVDSDTWTVGVSYKF